MTEDFEQAEPPPPMAVLLALERLIVGLATVVVEQSSDPVAAMDRLRDVARDANPPRAGVYADDTDYTLEQCLGLIAGATNS